MPLSEPGCPGSGLPRLSNGCVRNEGEFGFLGAGRKRNRVITSELVARKQSIYQNDKPTGFTGLFSSNGLPMLLMSEAIRRR